MSKLVIFRGKATAISRILLEQKKMSVFFLEGINKNLFFLSKKNTNILFQKKPSEVLRNPKNRFRPGGFAPPPPPPGPPTWALPQTPSPLRAPRISGWWAKGPSTWNSSNISALCPQPEILAISSTISPKYWERQVWVKSKAVNIQIRCHWTWFDQSTLPFNHYIQPLHLQNSR